MKRSRLKSGTKGLRRSAPIARTRWRKRRRVIGREGGDAWRKNTARRGMSQRERNVYGLIHSRSGDICEVTINGRRCTRWRMIGVHHLVKRSQKNHLLVYASDAVDICAFHHDLTDNASLSQKSTAPDGETRFGRLRLLYSLGKCIGYMEHIPAKRRSVATS